MASPTSAVPYCSKLYTTLYKVILGPYGLAGVLTGQGFKENDVSTQTLLAEWHQFYPLPLLNNSAHRSDATASSGDEEPLPCALEVLVGGVKLRYPSCYVFIAESDEPVSGQQTEPSQGTTPVTPAPAAASGPFGAGGGMHGAAPVRPHNFPAGIKPGIPPGLTAVLTPPTSPCEPGYLHGAMMAARTASGAAGTSQSSRPVRLVPPELPMGPHAAPSAFIAQKAKVATWQDSLVSRACDEETGASWEFCDPCGQTHCFCFRCNRSTRPCAASATSGTGSLVSRGPSPSPSGASSVKKPGADKSPAHSSLGSQAKPSSRGGTGSNSAPSTPFHRRSPVPGVDYEGAVALVSRVASGGLPQLSHQPAVGGPPPSVGSCSHPGTPLLLSEGPASQASQADPAMPTLSPHPPPRDEPRPSPAPGASPAPAVAESAKDRQPGEQLLSPSSLLEVKPPLEAPPSCSPGGTSHPWGGPGSVPSSSAATPLASTVVHAPPSVGTDEMPGTPLAAPGGPASLPPGRGATVRELHGVRRLRRANRSAGATLASEIARAQPSSLKSCERILPTSAQCAVDTTAFKAAARVCRYLKSGALGAIDVCRIRKRPPLYRYFRELRESSPPVNGARAVWDG
ncbi:hypothetical protein HPB51_009152 [Rhipicephalus microplus]|uniref:Mediator of RNA polymerase II transcription subunit 13 n=1 Tax=Rhipicephalus microplus TaxID=6941 RepID=A0A9J6F0Y1_RHIMP|nr:hypothetical protein HPB51_009152 [Rhipicephalus microplus]